MLIAFELKEMIDTKKSQEMCEQGKLFHNAQKYKEAEPYFVEAIRYNPLDPNNYENYAACCSWLNAGSGGYKSETILRCYEDALLLAPDRLYLQARISECRKAFYNFSHDLLKERVYWMSDVYFGLGYDDNYLARIQGQLKRTAVEDGSLEKSELKKDYKLGIVFFRKQDHKQAKLYLDAYLEMQVTADNKLTVEALKNRDHFQAFYTRGLIYQQEGDSEAAVDAFEKAIQLMCSVKGSVYRASPFLALQKEQFLLQQKLNQVKTMVVDLQKAYFNEDYSMVLKIAEEALKLSKRNAEVYLYAMLAALKLNKYVEASNFLTHFLQLTIQNNNYIAIRSKVEMLKNLLEKRKGIYEKCFADLLIQAPTEILKKATEAIFAGGYIKADKKKALTEVLIDILRVEMLEAQTLVEEMIAKTPHIDPIWAEDTVVLRVQKKDTPFPSENFLELIQELTKVVQQFLSKPVNECCSDPEQIPVTIKLHEIPTHAELRSNLVRMIKTVKGVSAANKPETIVPLKEVRQELNAALLALENILPDRPINKAAMQVQPLQQLSQQLQQVPQKVSNFVANPDPDVKKDVEQLRTSQPSQPNFEGKGKIENAVLQLRQEENQRRQQAENDKKEAFSRSLAEIDLAKKDNSCTLSTLHQKYKQLEHDASQMQSVDFFCSRADFYQKSAKSEENAIRREVLYRNALQDYRKAMAFDPFVSGVPEQITEIERLMKTNGDKTEPLLFSRKPAAEEPALKREDLNAEELAELERIKAELRAQQTVKPNKQS